MAPNNKLKFLTPLKFFYTSNYSLFAPRAVFTVSVPSVSVSTVGVDRVMISQATAPWGHQANATVDLNLDIYLCTFGGNFNGLW